MIVLGIDTATVAGSVAIVDGDRVLSETSSELPLGANLLAMIDAVCVGAGISALNLDAVAIGAGPGSFTGLRIGMATAKGIAFASHCPLWAVSSLAAMAFAEGPFDGVIAAVLDARRGEFYAGAYRNGIALGDERVVSPEQLGAFLAALPAPSRIVADIDVPGGSLALPTGAAVARLALAGDRADVLVAGAPSYVRIPEVELKYPDGVPGALRRR